jgi:predicted AAA+ superfamily ATPase
MPKRSPPWTPRSEDYGQVLLTQNPWHTEQRVPEELAFSVERPLGGSLWRRIEADEPRRFQLVLGPRRVGKTTCMYQTVRHLLARGVSAQRLWWFRLDHPLLMEFSLGDLVRIAVQASGATRERPVHLFFDELVYARDWDLWLKTFHDETWPVKIAATSSSTAALRKRRLESGVGRWEEQSLSPYLFGEFLSLIGKGIEIPVGASLAETLESCFAAELSSAGMGELRRRFLLTGGFPELLLGPQAVPRDEASALLLSQRTLRSDAVERALYKDIPQAFEIENPMMLERLLYVLAGQLAGVLSPNNICRNLGGLSQPTFDRYLSYLERTFLIFTLPNYSGSETSRQKRGRKLYFVDGAIRNAALQRGLAPLNDPVELGLLTENLVAGHLHALGQQTQVRVYHWRDRPDEVDLVYDHPSHPLAFEVASSPSHHRSGLLQFMERYPRFKRHCFLVAPGVPAAKPDALWSPVGTLPIDLLLLAISAQVQRELALRLGA